MRAIDSDDDAVTVREKAASPRSYQLGSAAFLEEPTYLTFA
jgi:hypothetical protein